MRDEAVRTFKALIQAKRMLILRASGYSMFPYIRPGDLCRFMPPVHPLPVGQIALAVNEEGILFSHRLLQAESTDEGTVYRLRGDLNYFNDRPVQESHIIGVLSDAIRKQKTLSENHRNRRIWSTLVVRFPFLFRTVAYACHRILPRLHHVLNAGRSKYGIRNRTIR